MLNKVILVGTVLKNPYSEQIKTTMLKAILVLRTTRTYTKEGQTVTENNDIEIVAWNKGCDEILKCKLGDNILVEARLKGDIWKDKATGQDKMRTSVYAERIIRLTGVQVQQGVEDAFAELASENPF